MIPQGPCLLQSYQLKLFTHTHTHQQLLFAFSLPSHFVSNLSHFLFWTLPLAESDHHIIYYQLSTITLAIDINMPASSIYTPLYVINCSPLLLWLTTFILQSFKPFRSHSNSYLSLYDCLFRGVESIGLPLHLHTHTHIRTCIILSILFIINLLSWIPRYTGYPSSHQDPFQLSFFLLLCANYSQFEFLFLLMYMPHLFIDLIIHLIICDFHFHLFFYLVKFNLIFSLLMVYH